MYANLFGNSTSFQTLYLLQGTFRKAVKYYLSGLPSDRFKVGTIYQSPAQDDIFRADGMM